MSLDSKYSPGDVRLVIKTGLEFHGPENTGTYEPGGYYSNAHALVLDASTDKVNPQIQLLQTIEQAFDAIKNIPDSEKHKKIIIPVAEEQRIFGIPRNHWVTLYYDPETNQATLIDSRPYIVSLFYPTSEMERLLRAGLKTLYGNDIAQAMRFNSKYQGVQRNDIHCGAWTSRNIRDLSGTNGPVAAIEEQIGKYKASDEKSVVLSNKELVHVIDDSEQNVSEPVKQQGAFRRFFNFITQGIRRFLSFLVVAEENTNRDATSQNNSSDVFNSDKMAERLKAYPANQSSKASLDDWEEMEFQSETPKEKQATQEEQPDINTNAEHIRPQP